MEPPTNPTAIQFQQTIEKLGLSGQVVEFEQTTRTAQDAAAAIDCQVGQIVKSLIFRAAKSGRPLLVLTSGANRVDEKRLRAHVGEKLGKADADFVRQQTGYAIGGVPPFGHTQPDEMLIYIDEDLLAYESIWAAAGTPNAVFELSPDELQQACQGTVIKVTQEQS